MADDGWQSRVCCYHSPVITPRACAQQGAKQSVYLLSVIVSTKIARSRDLSIWVTGKRNESVKIIKKLPYASNRLVRPMSIPKAAFCWPRLSTTPPCAFCSYAQLSYESLMVMFINKHTAHLAARYADAACRVCALESSSLMEWSHIPPDFKIMQNWLLYPLCMHMG